MFMEDPKMAKKWAKETPNIKDLPEEADEDILDELEEAVLKSETADVSKETDVKRRYDELKKKSTDDIFRIAKQIHNVYSKSDKETMIGDIMEAEFGKGYSKYFATSGFSGGDNVALFTDNVSGAGPQPNYTQDKEGHLVLHKGVKETAGVLVVKHKASGIKFIVSDTKLVGTEIYYELLDVGNGKKLGGHYPSTEFVKATKETASKFKVGDNVRVRSSPSFKGMVGKITDDQGEMPWGGHYYIVTFPVPGQHDQGVEIPEQNLEKATKDIVKSSRETDFEEKALQVMKVATSDQKRVFNDFQSGTERLFLMYLGSGPITAQSIDNTLQIMVNSVEGDTSQLETEHEKYARRKGWLKGFEVTATKCGCEHLTEKASSSDKYFQGKGDLKYECQNCGKQFLTTDYQKKGWTCPYCHSGDVITATKETSQLGKHSEMPDSEFDPNELSAGIKSELEHTDDSNIAKKIAKDHLVEDPAYYTHLKEMEAKYAKSEHSEAFPGKNSGPEGPNAGKNVPRAGGMDINDSHSIPITTTSELKNVQNLMPVSATIRGIINKAKLIDDKTGL